MRQDRWLERTILQLMNAGERARPSEVALAENMMVAH